MAPVDREAVTGAHAFTVLIGNPRPGSRTRKVVLRAADLLREQLGEAGKPLAEPSVVDLADLPLALFGAPADEHCPALAGALAAVADAGLLIVASPTYKGAYTGLLKLFLDLLPRQGLGGVIALPLMTAASPAHTHAVETHLRPLLVALGATVPVNGLSVLEAQFDGLDAVLPAWTAGTAPVLRGLLGQVRRERVLTDPAGC